MANIKLKDYLKTHHKSYISHKIERTDFVKYLQNLRVAYAQILEAVKTNATEENIKNTVINFIKNTFYNERKDIQINAFNNIDYAIKKNDNIEVIMEFKKPSNKAEMITCDNLNKKALHEAIKYFYDEKHKGNYHIKNIIISDGISYFIFNPLQFQHKSLEKLCYDSIEGDLYLQRTSEIYKGIANIITREKITFEFAWFDLTYLEKRIKDFDLNNVDINDKAIRTLLYVYKLFHPDFLLNEYSPKDSNQLNKKFYDELLYILGLEEVSENNKKLIKPNPNSNGLINETIKQLEDQKDITGEKAVNIAFELVITWLNRILFLKLFESQLVSFNDNKNFKFITSDKVIDFDELNKLFFSVLGKKIEDRDNAEETVNIPYLNSSLFEKSEMELKYINTTALNNNRKLALYKSSNLKHWSEYKNKTEEKILKYLLDFLDSYDFSSGAGESLITEENRDIINSAVLGLIFEKLNGYKDGSFYTPGFITEYMAKECIERAVVDKFNDAFDDLNAKNIQEIRNYIGNVYSADAAQKYNDIINSLRICDPAVGSGHFLVSVLNHIIYLKSYLGILFDDEGNKINNNIEIFDDTLVVFNQNDVPYVYKRKDKSTHQVQKALFKEKRTIIENCLFAVDINPKSVYICQLRLWIELLKNTYYIDNTNNMEVLPNIDINIKTGNSLVSKYPVQIGKAITQQGSKEQKNIIKQYKQLVAEYKNSGDKETKKKINETLREIKNKLYSVIEDVLVAETKEQKDFDKQRKKLKNKWKKATTIEERLKIEKEIEKLSKSNRGSNKILVIGDSFDDPIYKNSMEWMLEFPEILDEDGKFQGFDVVIGNPPYIKEYDNKDAFNGFREKSPYYMGKMDLWYGFACKGIDFLRKNGLLCFIAQNNWTTSAGAKIFRNKVINDTVILKLIDFNTYMIFDNASIQTMIMLFRKDFQKDNYSFDYRFLKSGNYVNDIFEKKEKPSCLYLEPQISRGVLQNHLLTFSKNDNLLNKIAKNKIYLQELEATNGIHSHHDFVDKKMNQLHPDLPINSGIFGLSNEEKTILSLTDEELSLIKPYYNSEQIHRYYTSSENKLWLIYTDSSFKNEHSMDKYPHLKKHLDKVREVITSDNKPYGLHRARQEHFFQKEKIIALRKCSGRPLFSYSDFDCYVSATYYIIQTNRWNMIFLTGLFNSKLIAFWLKNKGKMQGNNYQVDKEPLLNIPLPQLNDKEQQPIIDLVNQIILLKKNDINTDTSKQEAEIDKIVYQLYGLTDEEIKIVEEGL